MAYIDFTNPAPEVAGPSTAPASIAQTVVGSLARLEWEIVWLAQRDGVGSLREPGRIARFMGWAFGRDINRRLADPRLEALRRTAVLAWRYGYALPVSAIKDFKAAGFSMDQLEAVLVKVTSQRPRSATPSL